MALRYRLAIVSMDSVCSDSRHSGCVLSEFVERQIYSTSEDFVEFCRCRFVGIM